MKHSTTNNYLWLLAILFPVLFKVWPMASHYNPQIVLACYLSATSHRYKALISVMITAILSDLASGYVSAYGAFGGWTWFTYSALLIIAWSAAYTSIRPHQFKWLGITITASLAFWLWTNWGVWWTGTLYEHTLTGLLQCYLLALPFLEYSLVSALLWSSLIVGCYHIATSSKKRHCAKFLT